MNYDLIIIGSGPAGYVAAIRAGQTGLKTLVIDKQYVGGMCLNWGCIPSKSLLESAKLYAKIKKASDFGITGLEPAELGFDWQKALSRTGQVVKKLSRGIEYLWKKNGVEYLRAEAKVLSATQVEAGNSIYEAKHIMVATGSRPAKLEGLKQVVELDELLQLEALPQKILLYGRGSILFEQASLLSMLDKEVQIVYSALPLIPGLDEHLESYVLKKLKKDKIKLHSETDLQIVDGIFTLEGQPLDYDILLNCSFRKAVLPQMPSGLELDKGFIKVDANFQSTIPGIYAVGDVNGLSFLAHTASAQGLAVVNHIQGKTEAADLSLSPLNIYSYPEIAQVGKTEAMLKAEAIDYKAAEYQLTANGKAQTEGSADGFLRLLYEDKYKQVLGVQIVSEHATDMIAEAALLMQMEGTIYELAGTIHAHPTVSEVFMELGAQELNTQRE